MSRGRSVVSVLIAGIGLAVGAPAQAPSTTGTVLTVEQAAIDLGEITAGTEASATFVMHNLGERDIRILRAKPS